MDNSSNSISAKYYDLSAQITGAIFKVSNTLGCGFLEKVYETALVYELRKKGLKAEVQKEIRILYDGVDLGLSYFADILVEDSVIIELKAVEALDKIHKAQVINYLKATGLEFGVLVNFGTPRAEIERLVNTRSQ